VGTWAVSELQFFAGDSTGYPDWLAPPLEVHVLLSHSADPAVRRYALDRMLYVSKATDVIERMAESDLDPEIRAHAARILLWRDDFGYPPSPAP
jgi:hypothetical protein